MSKYCLSVFAVILFIAGCKSSTETNGGTLQPQSNALVPPGVGSVFVYHYVMLDASGTTLEDSIAETDSVVATHLTIFGRSNVMQIAGDGFIANQLSNYWNYDSAGDLSYYEDYQGQPGYHNGWVRVPITTKGSATFVAKDTTSFGSPTSESYTYTYSGASLIPVTSSMSFQTAFFNYGEVTDNNANRTEQRYFDRVGGIPIRFELVDSSATFRYQLHSATLK